MRRFGTLLFSVYLRLRGDMYELRRPIAWVASILLVSASMSWEGCGKKESTAAPVVEQTPAQSQQTQNSTQLPEVNLTPDGLDELMAPVALYPDPVLGLMMQASTNPQEVMDAGNWLVQDQNKNLQGTALDDASKKAGFTPVVQALLHYPDVVDLMCTQFDWTKQLGAAYLANSKAVMDSVQRLRAQAVDNGALKSSPQMKVDVTKSNGQQVVELKPSDPKTVYIPQYNPDQVFQTTTTTTQPDGTTTTTTTTSGPASSAASTSTNTNTTTVKEKEGVSTGTAVLVGLLSFGAGIAVGAAISNNNNYYYPAWGYGGVWYGPRPYYPPPYHPVYYGGWGGGYAYNRPAYYRQTNIYVNNNYYNRFNNNHNLNAGYRPRPVPYNTNSNSLYSRNIGSQPGARQGVNYRPTATNASNLGSRPVGGNATNRAGGATPATRPGGVQRPSVGASAGNWKGQSTYQGRTGESRAAAGDFAARNPAGDRGFAQNGGARPSTGNFQGNRPNAGNAPNARPTAGNTGMARPSPGAGQVGRPSTGNAAATRPAPGNAPVARPSVENRPAPNASARLSPNVSQNRPSQTRPTPQAQTASRPQPSTGGAFNGANNARADREASQRGRASMGAHSNFGGRKR